MLLWLGLFIIVNKTI